MFESPALNHKIIFKIDTYICLLYSAFHVIQSFQILNYSWFSLALSRTDRQRECQAADTIKRGLILLMQLKNVCQAQEHATSLHCSVSQGMHDFVFSSYPRISSPKSFSEEQNYPVDFFFSYFWESSYQMILHRLEGTQC